MRSARHIALPLLFLLAACGPATKRKVGGGSGGDDVGLFAGGNDPGDNTPTMEPAYIVGSGGGSTGQPRGVITPAPGAPICGSVNPGDLKVTEVMIATRTDLGDAGEWFEVESTRADCTINLRGLHIESERRSTVDSLDVEENSYLAPGGRFVVANASSAVPAAPEGSPLFLWDGAPVVDAIRTNETDHILITLNELEIQNLELPPLAGAANIRHALSFSTECAWTDYSNFAHWAWSDVPYFDNVNLFGSPYLPNADVGCN